MRRVLIVDDDRELTELVARIHAIPRRARRLHLRGLGRWRVNEGPGRSATLTVKAYDD